MTAPASRDRFGGGEDLFARLDAARPADDDERAVADATSPTMTRERAFSCWRCAFGNAHLSGVGTTGGRASTTIAERAPRSRGGALDAS